jgi:hypothetical protein
MGAAQKAIKRLLSPLPLESKPRFGIKPDET